MINSLRLSVCFRNLKCKKGHNTAMDQCAPDFCFKLRKHLSGFQASIWLFRRAELQLRNSP